MSRSCHLSLALRDSASPGVSDRGPDITQHLPWETPAMGRGTIEREPTYGPERLRNYGIACQPRGSWRQSSHSTQMIGAMPDTWGRGTGLRKSPRLCAGGREPQGDKQSRQTQFRAWKAGCVERRLSSLGRGGWKRTVFMKPPGGFLAGRKKERHLADRLLHRTGALRTNSPNNFIWTNTGGAGKGNERCPTHVVSESR